MVHKRPHLEHAEQQPTKTVSRFPLLNDLYVDLLGSLVPGLFTVILGGAVVFLTLSVINTAIFARVSTSSVAWEGVGTFLAGFHWEVATIVVVSSYIVGVIFFRQDPQRPDGLSALRVWLRSTEEDRPGLAAQSTKSTLSPTGQRLDGPKLSWMGRTIALLRAQHYAKGLELDTKFPYLHLKCYLSARGLTHLAPYVPWCPKVSATKGYRTKMFINILKLRIHARAPEICRDIIRNEAHVRLATSVWYASTCLMWIAGCSLLAILGISPLCVGNRMGSELFAPISLAALVFLFCLTSRYDLNRCIHYMRVREVVYVLETALLAERISGKPIFAELSEKVTPVDCTKCHQARMVPSPSA